MGVGIDELELIESHGRIFISVRICELGVYPVRDAENSQNKAEDEEQPFAHGSNLGKTIFSRRSPLKFSNRHMNHLQNTTLMMRMMSSSGEKIVRASGNRGAAVAVARREMSSSPKGTERISRTMA